MIVLVIVAALGAALLNAVAIVMQRRAAGERLPKELYSRQLFLSLAKRKLWLASVGLQLVGFGLQAVALNFGSIILVEPITATVLVFLFLILHFYYKIRAGKREWIAVAAVIIGMSALLGSLQPHGGHIRFDGPAWLVTTIIILVVVTCSIIFVRHSKSPKLRAAVGGIGVAFNIGYSAGLTKLVLEKFGENPAGILGSWEIYALGASALLLLVMFQSVFAAGPLVISQPIIEIVNPIVSSIIGITLFHNIVNTSLTAMLIAIPGLILAAFGLALLGSSKRYEHKHLAATS
jgi:hypothetical protein